MYFSQEQIDRANQADLVSFLQAQGEQLERAGNEYRWKRHDSLTVRGNKWYRHRERRTEPKYPKGKPPYPGNPGAD